MSTHGHVKQLGSAVHVAGTDNWSKQFSSEREKNRTVTLVGATWWEWRLVVSYILYLKSEQEGKSHKREWTESRRERGMSGRLKQREKGNKRRKQA